MVESINLLQGLDVVDGKIQYKKLTLRELVKIGMEKWQEIIPLCILEVKDLFANSELTADELSQIRLYDAICIAPVLRQWTIDFLNTFLYGEWQYNEVFCEFVCYSLDVPIVIDRNNIEEVFANIRKIYCVNKPVAEFDDSKATSQDVLNMLKEFEEIKKKQKKDEEGITYESIIESVSVKHPSYNLLNIWDLTLYQLMRSYYRIEHIDNYNYVMKGIYSGVISNKDIKLKEIHWSNKIVT